MRDGEKVCPLMSNPQASVPCQKDACALWASKNRDEYSGCSIVLISRNIGGMSYRAFLQTSKDRH